MSDETMPAQLDTISAQFEAGNQRMQRIEEGQVAQDRRLTRMQAELSENTNSTARIEKNTADLIEFFEAMQGAFKVFNWLGKAAKPIGYIAAAATAIGAFIAHWKGGK